MTGGDFTGDRAFPFHPEPAHGKLVPMSTHTSFLSVAAAMLAALTLSPSAPAQDTPDPGFSILAPASETPQNGEAEASPAPRAPAGTSLAPPAQPGTAGPWLGREAYLALRSGSSAVAIPQDEDTATAAGLAPVRRMRWRVETATLDGTPLDATQREILIGDGYVTEPGSEQNAVYDFALGRILSRIQSPGGPVMQNRPIVAHVHRQMNTFAYFTRGGELDEVTGPGGSLFERFWIEAAMGVRLSPVTMAVSESDNGHVSVRRDPLGSEIFGFDADDTGTPAEAALFKSWMRHALPIHPDALNAMPVEAGIPSRFSFLVFSPSSPDGRRETWTRLSTSAGEAAFPWPENVPAVAAEGYADTGSPTARLIAAGLSALQAPTAEAPTSSTLAAASEAAQLRADYAGAYLSLYQIAHHSGPCRATSTDPACTRMAQIAAAGLGNADFEALMEALAQLPRDRLAALATLRQHLHRTGYAGGAANLLAAQALATERANTPDAMAELDPMALFAASAEADPFAPLVYWHAGRYAASQDDVESAWLLFEIALGLPGSSELPPSREASAMREQLQTLAPGFFGPITAR